MLSEVLAGVRTCPPDCATCERLRGAAAAAVLMTGGAEVTVADLAAAAGVPASAVAGHCPEGAARVVADAYRRAAGELYGEYAASFRLADTWPEKLGAALERLLRRLAAEPAMAHLCFVAPVFGGEELREIRESFRARYVELLVFEQDRDADDDADEDDLLPVLALELMVSAVFRTIGVLVADGRAPELPLLIEDVAGAAQVFEPRVALTA
jgi:AcrR family transcriptional regulator